MNPLKHLAVCAFLSILALPAAALETLGEVAFIQTMKDLRHDIRLMCVAAHPDDEDGATLALHRFKYGVETHAVLSTRGEGGQNEIGPELYDELAVIRTREQIASSAVTDAQVHFLNLPEFGFSKTLEETLAVWGEEEVVGRMVQIIREVRPHVIITNHGREKDHGHHQATGYALLKAFDLAGDAAAYPEQIQRGLQPWQPQRLYIRAWEPGPESIEIPISELDPARGQTYAQIAAQALAVHAPQGMELFIQRYLSGRPSAWYDLVKTSDPGPAFDSERMDDSAGPLFKGVVALYDRALTAIANTPGTRAELKPKLFEALRAALLKRGRGKEFDAQWQRANDAAAAACEVRLSAEVSDKIAVAGQQLSIEASVRDFGEADFNGARFWLEFAPGFRAQPIEPVASTLTPDEDAAATLTITVPDRTPLTMPNTAVVATGLFPKPQITVVAALDKSPDVVELRFPLYIDIAPRADIRVISAPQFVPAGMARTVRIDAQVTGFAPGPQDLTLRFLPEPFTALPPETGLQIPGADSAMTASAEVTIPADTPPGVYTAGVMSDALGRAAEGKILVADIAVPEGLRVGLIDSYDTTLRETLDMLEIAWGVIGEDDWAEATLDSYDTIVADMRAYRYRPDLRQNNRMYLDYAARGGTAVVLYQKTFEWQEEYAPYPLSISRNRVTLEDAPVELLAPEHTLFQKPNAITAEDWNGWVQERGLYFAERWADQYTPLISVADPGETIPPGSWLVAQHGAGHYVYSALVWYRQLRELNPGALRLFVNLLSLGK